MIPKETVSRIFEAAKIEEVVGRYVNLKKRGANLLGLCPFHHEKTGSFTVSPSKGIYKCFGCSKAGNAVRFVMDIEQCSYVEALRMIAQMYHITIEERQLTKEEQQKQDDRESMLLVNDFANKWFQE
jgi:DNA primase